MSAVSNVERRVSDRHAEPRMYMRGFGALLLAVWCAAVVGCEGYALRGRVVGGRDSDVAVVDKGDARLTGDEVAIPGARVAVTLDPQSLGRRPLKVVVADDEGRFEVPIDAAGAGFLEYDVEVVVRAAGAEPAVQTLRLPGSGKRLLVTLTRGRDTLPQSMQEVVDETREVGGRLMDR